MAVQRQWHALPAILAAHQSTLVHNRSNSSICGNSAISIKKFRGNICNSIRDSIRVRIYNATGNSIQIAAAKTIIVDVATS